jgi:hypothetical protein
MVTETKFIEVNGLDWRTELAGKLKLIRSQNGTSVWLIRKSDCVSLFKHTSNVVTAPKVTVFESNEATISNKTTRLYVKSVQWIEDGRGGFAGKPEVGQIGDGHTLKIQGRKLDQGVLAKVDLDSTRIMSIGNFPVSRAYTDDKGKPAELAAITQQPDLLSAKAVGEWLVPEGHVLLISMGAWHEVGDSWGRKTYRQVEMIHNNLGIDMNVYKLGLIVLADGEVADLPERMLAGTELGKRLSLDRYWASPIIERLVMIEPWFLSEADLATAAATPKQVLAPILADPTTALLEFDVSVK